MKLSNYPKRLFHVLRIQEDDPPAIVDAAITIIQPVNRCIELIVRTHSRQDILSWHNRQAFDRVDCKVGFSGPRPKFSLVSRRIRQVKGAARDPRIELLETGNKLFDFVSDQIVVIRPAAPG